MSAFDGKTVPVFLIAYNRLGYLRQLVAWLERAGYSDIHIIDNCSSYPPLLEYLERSPHAVHRMDRNYGHLVLWESGRFGEIVNGQHFILSDCDILPDEACPPDVADHLYAVLRRYPNFTKVGLSLRIDDIPDHYALKPKVLEWEAPFWQHPLDEPGLYEAAIDTTFALYRPGIAPGDPRWFRSIRTAPPHTARHLPWYADTSRPTEEDVFYQDNLHEMSSQWSVTDPILLKEQNIKLQLEVLRLRSELDALRVGYRRSLWLRWRARLIGLLKVIGLSDAARRLRRRLNA